MIGASRLSWRPLSFFARIDFVARLSSRAFQKEVVPIAKREWSLSVQGMAKGANT
jgi:hypothetical protein